MEQVHAAKGGGEGQRHGDAGDERGPEAAQKHKNYHYDERNAQHERELHFLNRGADRLGPVTHGSNLDGRGQPFHQARQLGFNAIHRLDDIRFGFLEDNRDYGFVRAGPPGLAIVFDTLNYTGHRTELDRAADFLGFSASQADRLRRWSLLSRA